MRKMKKLVSYLILLAIPVAIAAALFVFNGSGYRLSEQDAADIAYKMQVSKLEISQSAISKLRYGLQEVIVLVSQHQTTILNTLLMVSQDLF